MRISVHRSAAMVMSAVLAGAVVTGVSPAAAESSTCVATELRLPAGTPSNVHSSLASSDVTGRYQVGHIQQPDGRLTPLLWTAGEPSLLGPVPDGRSFVVDVNSRGVVLGFTVNPDGQRQPWLYSDGTHRKLAMPAGLVNISVKALNDRGDVVGSGLDEASSTSSAIVWPAAGEPRRLLATGSAAGSAEARDINEAGVVIGNFYTEAGAFGMIWRNWDTEGERVTGKNGASVGLRQVRGNWFIGYQSLDGGYGGALFTTLSTEVASFPKILDGVNGSGDVTYTDDGGKAIVARPDGTQYAIDAVGHNTASYLFERGSAYDAAGDRDYGYGRAVLWSGCAS
ncbi:hypothetical protein [Kribbella sp. NPDC023855]|uniref:hypothetical protein n=1 Tax=Kribbella sp. NPDC023855 TaxID=3154698 RepID=UPI0033C7B32B